MKVTLESILEQLRIWVEDKHPVSKQTWLDSAQKLNVLSSDLDDEISDLKCDIADVQAELIRNGSSVAEAKALSNSGDTYRHLKKKEALKDRVVEHIRIAKKRAEIQEFTD